MKKIISLLLIGCVVLSLCSCEGKTSENQDTPSTETSVDSAEEATEVAAAEEATEATPETAPETAAETTTEDDLQSDMDELSAIGDVEVNNGILTVSLTVPKDIAGDTTQEDLDQSAGDTYVSAKLNDDGSVTYKMTKAQHKAMLEGLVESIDSSLQEMIDDDNYTFTDIKHNDDYTQFDVTLSGTELGIVDGFATIGFYMYGGLYGIFSGHSADSIVVNFYDVNGNIIQTGNSADMDSN